MTWFQYLFSFKGRINRARFWFFFFVLNPVAQLIYALVAYAIIYAWNGRIDIDWSDMSILKKSVLIILTIPLIPIGLISPFAIYAKRFHDRNKSGWWQLAFFVAPVFLVFLFAQDPPIIPPRTFAFECATVAGVVGYIGMIVLTIEILFIRGTRGNNRFGPDPLAPKATAAES
jgi:uncharacterized membrane protein YhaH (DUF805 family)